MDANANHVLTLEVLSPCTSVITVLTASVSTLMEMHRSRYGMARPDELSRC